MSMRNSEYHEKNKKYNCSEHKCSCPKIELVWALWYLLRTFMYKYIKHLIA